MARLRAKLFWSEVSFCRKNMFLIRMFLRNRPLTYFRGLTDCLARLGAKLFQTKPRSILPQKPPKLIFRKTRFRSELFYETTPHLFLGPNGPYGVVGGKIVPKRSFVLPKKHVFVPNFFTKPPYHQFSRPNELFGAFGGKTISKENFAPFCLGSPLSTPGKILSLSFS
jgi:hypothetical protein